MRDKLYPCELAPTRRDSEVVKPKEQKFVSSPFSEYEKQAIFGVMDDLRDAVRFSDGVAGYPQNPDRATSLLRLASRKLTALI